MAAAVAVGGGCGAVAATPVQGAPPPALPRVLAPPEAAGHLRDVLPPRVAVPGGVGAVVGVAVAAAVGAPTVRPRGPLSAHVQGPQRPEIHSFCGGRPVRLPRLCELRMSNPLVTSLETPLVPELDALVPTLLRLTPFVPRCLLLGLRAEQAERPPSRLLRPL